jgi:hypothetical protein
VLDTVHCLRYIWYRRRFGSWLYLALIPSSGDWFSWYWHFYVVLVTTVGIEPGTFRMQGVLANYWFVGCRKTSGRTTTLDGGPCVSGWLAAAKEESSSSSQSNSRMLCGWLHSEPDRRPVQLNKELRLSSKRCDQINISKRLGLYCSGTFCHAKISFKSTRSLLSSWLHSCC